MGNRELTALTDPSVPFLQVSYSVTSEDLETQHSEQSADSTRQVLDGPTNHCDDDRGSDLELLLSAEARSSQEAVVLSPRSGSREFAQVHSGGAVDSPAHCSVVEVSYHVTNDNFHE